MAEGTKPNPAVPFSTFMDRALYGPDGFYERHGVAGRRGDFITSVEVGPLFGAVVGRFLDEQWRQLDCPEQFTVVEVGAGVGTMARTVAASSPACTDALHYVAVERSGRQRQQHPDWVTSVDSVEQAGLDTPITGVVIANELLDNLPFDLAVYDGAWRRAMAQTDGDRWFETLGEPVEPLPSVLPPRAPHGARAPLLTSASEWVRAARDFVGAGTVVAFDYGVARTAELVLRPWREWLRTYKKHERGGHYLEAPGTQDITVDVAFDQLPEPTTLRSQEQWLRRYGIDDLVEEGREYWHRHAAAPDVAAMRMRSRIAEAEALLDPNGLGAFWVLEWRSID